MKQYELCGIAESWRNAIVPVYPPFNIEENPLYEELRSRAIKKLNLTPWARWSNHTHKQQLAIDAAIHALAAGEHPNRLQVRDGVTYLNNIPLIGWFRRVEREKELAAQ